VTKVPDDVRLDLRERARYFAELTDVGVPRSALAAPTMATVAPTGEASRLASPSAPRAQRAPAAPVFTTEGVELRDLEAVRAWIGDCQRCKLAGGRKTIVFGQGSPQAALMFVGEAPGADEDEQGLAFVGRAGQLLTDIIEKGLKIPRKDVFIANVLKCLKYNTLVQLENGSWERIGRLVAQRYAGNVMSVDSEGRLVPKRVTGWYRSPLAGREVYRLSYVSSAIRGGNRAVTRLTADHEVLTRRGWMHAACLEPRDAIAVGQGLSRVALDVVTGSLLGDGTISRKSAYLAMNHCLKQEEYVRLKARALSELKPVVWHGSSRARKGDAPRATVGCRTLATRALRVLRRRFYSETGKVIPRDFKLNARTLAVWFLDDGYTKVKSDHCAMSEIAAHSFVPEDIERLSYHLYRDLGLDAYRRPASPGRLHFDAEATRRLSEIVAPFCPPSLRYKLHPDVRDVIPFDERLFDPEQPETLFDDVVTEREVVQEKNPHFFCIDVEDTHAFVTSGGVVHNCRPPQNRNPEPDEILSCQPFLEKQIALIRPKVLVGLGKFSAQWLFKSMEPISRLRGRIGDYDGIKVVPTFHPAYLLRNPGAKKDVWEDMKVVRRLLAKDEP
jgi:uracil-DNA glycosylase